MWTCLASTFSPSSSDHCASTVHWLHKLHRRLATATCTVHRRTGTIHTLISASPTLLSYHPSPSLPSHFPHYHHHHTSPTITAITLPPLSLPSHFPHYHHHHTSPTITAITPPPLSPPSHLPLYHHHHTSLSPPSHLPHYHYHHPGGEL